MKNYDQSLKVNHNSSRSDIPDQLYGYLIIDGSISGKTNVLLNQMLMKFISMSKILSNESINCLLMENKKQELKY